MRKLLLGLALFSLILLSMFVVAINPNQSLNIQKGWNLVSAQTISADIFDTRGNSQLLKDLNEKGIKAIFFYNVEKNKYVQLYPSNKNKEKEVEELFSSVDATQIYYSTLWIYSEKAQSLDFTLNEESINNWKPELSIGWNFIGITPNLLGKTIFEIKGNCNIEKAYYWNADVRGASGWSEVGSSNNRFDQENIWAGFIVKVSDDCTLGSGNALTNPPQIPN